jgi:inosine/xanthosine triphosphatase
MKKILVASENPVKIRSALRGFQTMFPNTKFKAQGKSIDSGVKEQPMTDAETFKGAYNRATSAIKKHSEFDFYIGIEGGTDQWNGEMTTFAWVVIRSGKKLGKGRTATFFLPQKASELIKEGKELGDAMDIIFNMKNTKQKQGAIGLLTDNVIDRAELYIQAVIIALIPFKKKKAFS